MTYTLTLSNLTTGFTLTVEHNDPADIGGLNVLNFSGGWKTDSPTLPAFIEPRSAAITLAAPTEIDLPDLDDGQHFRTRLATKHTDTTILDVAGVISDVVIDLDPVASPTSARLNFIVNEPTGVFGDLTYPQIPDPEGIWLTTGVPSTFTLSQRLQAVADVMGIDLHVGFFYPSSPYLDASTFEGPGLGVVDPAGASLKDLWQALLTSAAFHREIWLDESGNPTDEFTSDTHWQLVTVVRDGRLTLQPLAFGHPGEEWFKEAWADASTFTGALRFTQFRTDIVNETTFTLAGTDEDAEPLPVMISNPTRLRGEREGTRELTTHVREGDEEFLPAAQRIYDGFYSGFNAVHPGTLTTDSTRHDPDAFDQLAYVLNIIDEFTIDADFFDRAAWPQLTLTNVTPHARFSSIVMPIAGVDVDVTAGVVTLTITPAAGLWITGSEDLGPALSSTLAQQPISTFERIRSADAALMEV